MALQEDPFTVLGISEDATNAKVESAFRHLALRCHPDRHPKDPLAKSRFIRLSRAKEVLLNPAKRRAALSHRQSRFVKRQKESQRTGANDVKTGTADRQKREAAERRLRKGCEEAERLKREAAKRQGEVAAERLRKKEAEAQDKKRRAKEEADVKRRREELIAEEDARERVAHQERLKADVFEAFLRRKQTKAPPRHPEETEPVTFAEGKTDHARRYRAQPSPGVGASDRHRRALENLQIRRSNGEGLTHTPTGSWWVHDEQAERWAKYVDHCGF